MSDNQDQWNKDDYGDDNNHQSEFDSIDQADNLQGDQLAIKAEYQSSSISDQDQEEDSEQSICSQNRNEIVNLQEDAPAFLVPNSVRITNPYISKYQIAAVIGKRAQQISRNSPVYIQISENNKSQISPMSIAEQQYYQNKIPFIIRRFLPNGQFQDWKISELKK